MSEFMKKQKFVPLFLEVIRKDLLNELPDEDFENDYIDKAWDIIADKVKHIWRAVH